MEQFLLSKHALQINNKRDAIFWNIKIIRVIIPQDHTAWLQRLGRVQQGT